MLSKIMLPSLKSHLASGQSAALRLFHEMAERVPAYKDFLKQHGVSPKTVKTAADFKQLPTIDKDNYLRKYPLDQLCWDGTLSASQMISVSSGSSGQPFFWPHGADQHEEGALIHRYIYEKIFAIDDAKTLVVVCFSMGTWIAGPFTMLSSLGVSDRHETLNVITPGIDKEDAVQAIKSLLPAYDKLIVAGYPPIVKDVIDEATEAGVKWGRKDVSLLLAGEAISEEWRDYVLEEIGNQDPYHSSINIYGTADATIVGHETPYSILIRRIYNQQPELIKSTFGVEILPTLVQYYPERRFFEQVDKELVFSARAGLPLCRYNIHDSGTVLSTPAITASIAEELQSQLQQTPIRALDFWRKLPFVALNGRTDFTITLYGLLIFPENIKAALVRRELRGLVSGKFVMATKYDSEMEQHFDIKIELRKDIQPERALTKLIKEHLVETLTTVNAEYRKLHKSLTERADPRVKLYPHGHKLFKTTRPKHQWTKKSHGSSSPRR